MNKMKPLPPSPGPVSIALLFMAAVWGWMPSAYAGEKSSFPDGYVSSRSFVDQAEIVSKYTTEQYAHQSSLRIVKALATRSINAMTTRPRKTRPARSPGWRCLIS